VSARHDREAHGIDIFLNSRHRDHVGGLMEPGVDDLEPCIAQRAGHDLGATVVAIETGLGD
jgi:hypothetical protein